MSRPKKGKDPRKELRALAKELAACDPKSVDDAHNVVVDAQRLGRMVLNFLKNEQTTIVMNQDEYGMTATVHPSPHYARLEMVSNMLDIGDNYFMDREGHEFLKMVAEGKFRAAIDFWNEESIAQGSDGSYFDTHNGKVERNYTVAELKRRAQDALDDAQKLGRYKPCAFIEAGTVVHGRGDYGKGTATGKTRRCTMAGCSGLRIVVKWPDDHITMPCSKGMSQDADGSWRIE